LCHRRPERLPASPQSQYSLPQRPGESAWNVAHSRNRRIFDDRAGLAAARNVRPYLIQVYARDMGNGVTVVMREIDARSAFSEALGRFSIRLQPLSASHQAYYSRRVFSQPSR
jgi:hypothetical protein